MVSGLEREILEELHTAGNLSPSLIAERIERHPKSVSRSLRQLEADGLVVNLGGVWALTVSGARAAQDLLRD